MRPPHQQSALRALLPGGALLILFANLLSNATHNERPAIVLGTDFVNILQFGRQFRREIVVKTSKQLKLELFLPLEFGGQSLEWFFLLLLH